MRALGQQLRDATARPAKVSALDIVDRLAKFSLCGGAPKQLAS